MHRGKSKPRSLSGRNRFVDDSRVSRGLIAQKNHRAVGFVPNIFHTHANGGSDTFTPGWIYDNADRCANEQRRALIRERTEHHHNWTRPSFRAQCERRGRAAARL